MTQMTGINRMTEMTIMPGDQDDNDDKDDQDDCNEQDNCIDSDYWGD